MKAAGQDEQPLARLRRRVFKPIQEKLYLPLNHLIDRLGYFSSLLLLAVVTGASALAIHLWNNPEEARRVVTVTRFYLDARKSTPPHPRGVTEVIRDLANQLKDDIPHFPKNSPWEEAQMAVSLQGQDAFDANEMARWFTSKTGNCSCWQGDSSDPGHVGATSWVLLAFARMRIKPTEKAIEFLLGQQRRPGWWAIFPASDEPQNASTYATAFSIWALQELLDGELVAASQRQRAAEAVNRGRNWLLNNSLPGRPGRWKDYPNGGYGRESVGVSGLVLHVLHRTPGPSPSANDLDWMLSLPAELPEPNDAYSSGQIVKLDNQSWLSDPTHQFMLPWLIIGTVDAYSRGSLSQRAKAARLFHEIPEKREAIATEVRDMPWLAAEILISLRYLEGEHVI